MANRTGSDAVLLDTRGLEPSPERLLEIARRSAELPARAIVFDWGGRFPWRLDAGTCAPDAFPEQLVSALGSTVTSAGCRLGIRLRSALPEGYTSRIAYRHLDRARDGAQREWRRALEKLISDLIDDLRELLPGLSDLELVMEPAEADAVREAAGRAGLEVRATPMHEEPAASGELLGGIEPRLVRSGHPAATDRPVESLHERLASWRAETWMQVATVHEELVRAGADASWRGERLASAVKSLSRELRAGNSLRREFVAVYDGLAPAQAVGRFIRTVAAPLREQHGQLAARAAVVRSLR
jgi:hypothetical protein